jgi:hypothetical protein
MTAPTEVEILRQELAEARAYADRLQRAVTYWQQAHQRVAEALQFVDPFSATVEQVLETAKVVSTPTPYPTLRDQFAMSSLGAMLAASHDAFLQGEELDSPQDVAKAAYVMADAMLEARK